jgi:AcrR family transcriptional regulator
VRSLSPATGRARTTGPVDGPGPVRPSRDRLVIEGLAAVAEDGLASLTIGSLAARLGVSEGAVLGAVPGRDALVDLLVDHVNGLVLATAATRPASSAWVLACHRQVWAAHRRLTRAYRAGVLGGPNEEALVALLAGTLDREGSGGTGPRATARYRLLHALVPIP